ncbi:hypothetical protein BUALT_Bualt05G0163700 [Buddleja alternifolia]|uniref:Uncharacterized protein n=1 Tax=Buddleja alternifolia TaxID=168488 RepID=A0AAV6XSF8_9LAMI|nr:hypothetical protein BUALT_Bualt05G0163700 [Buddleja alternifolia]
MHSAMSRLRVHIFLSGLDSEFDQVRGEILRKDPKLDLESSYAYVRREYQQRHTMGGSRSISENAAMVAHQTRQGPPSSSSNIEEPSQPTANVTQPDFNHLQSVRSSSQSVITTANGSTSPITGEGSVILSSTLTLDTVLVVPSLEYNLLSDILTRKIRGYGVKRGKLYYLELKEHGGQEKVGGVSTPPIQRETFNEGNVLQEDNNGDEILELEEVNERYKRASHESESPMIIETELPALTPLPEEFT